MLITPSYRFINSRSISVVPGAMLTQDVKERKQILTRRFPMRLDPTALIAKSDDRTDEGDTRYTAGGQNALDRSSQDLQLKLDNGEISRALIIWTAATMRAASRQLVWEEAERERRQELRRRGQDPNDFRTPFQHYDKGDLESNVPFLHPWPSKMEFEQQVDAWREELIQRAGMALRVNSVLGWAQGPPELNKETRKQFERQRKMSVSATHSVPLQSPTSAGHRDLAASFLSRARVASDHYAGLDSMAPMDDKAAEESVALLGFREVGVITARKAWT